MSFFWPVVISFLVRTVFYLCPLFQKYICGVKQAFVVSSDTEAGNSDPDKVLRPPSWRYLLHRLQRCPLKGRGPAVPCSWLHCTDSFFLQFLTCLYIYLLTSIHIAMQILLCWQVYCHSASPETSHLFGIQMVLHRTLSFASIIYLHVMSVG